MCNRAMLLWQHVQSTSDLSVPNDKPVLQAVLSQVLLSIFFMKKQTIYTFNIPILVHSKFSINC